MTDELTRAQRSSFRTDRIICTDLVDVVEVLATANEEVHTMAALLTTADQPGSGWKTDAVSSSTVSNPTLAAVAGDQYVLDKLDEYRTKLKAGRDLLHEAYLAGTVVVAAGTERPHAPPPGAGNCIIDGDWVPGIGEDRIRRGLCPKHYQQWRRAGRPDIIGYPEHPDTDNTVPRATFPGCDDEDAVA